MNFRIEQLILDLKQDVERVPFRRFTYFYGQIGAGKTSIARLVDYCLGGRFDPTPALQAEFVSATLDLVIGKTRLQVRRDVGSDQIIAEWIQEGRKISLALPARKAAGEVLPGTGVEILSDLLFLLAGLPIARVRKSKVNDGSPLERLSFRDLWNFCYLDQDEIDSNFFDLDGEAQFAKRLKARDVLRYVLGYHQEHVSELEAKLDQVRQRRAVLESSADALRQALVEVGVTSVEGVKRQIAALQRRIKELQEQRQQAREASFPNGEHEVDRLRGQAREVFQDITDIEQEMQEVDTLLRRDERQLNDLFGLRHKFKRDSGARAVLGSVNFTHCPRCTQSLPDRPAAHCVVCGQEEPREVSGDEHELVNADLKLRIEELEDITGRQRAALRRLEGDLRRAQREKAFVDRQINDALARYDSQYLSQNLDIERQLAALERERLDLERLRRLPEVIEQNVASAHVLAVEEKALKEALKGARSEAQQDSRNLERLRTLFLDCLVRAKLAGFNRNDIVTFEAPDFFPRVATAGEQDMVFTSFSNLSSGGKKTLFKCCFAIALHRLAALENAPLPKILMIDSPMKNISERENREQFEGFHDMLYDLATNELQDTQFVFIDKEYKTPSANFDLDEIYIRHMTPDQDDAPPLIRYYRGK
ncbi:hypothetical protein HNQ07_004085 [Deinococcus metalli]|uniref:Rad50/SbcC-type AAA domain-containing protein n=1 Tax=Deinococcus metalli TaxID=1141878 RepID=A0A7W8KJZ0_9DEIO|nr:AAA family ATPase [Deinococcus metalli]MBB5378578.1 hypothetical protein [Deinococcus metalli]GHF58753.1 hypothetical protein GCM10017781_38810 [Deinococcus metalli]